MSYADRVDRDLEQRDRDLWDAHQRGEHNADDPDLDCAPCRREMREALNREGAELDAEELHPAAPWNVAGMS